MKKPLIALAPMAGITDASFRKIIKEQGGADLLFSEMISAASLFFQSSKKNKSWQLMSSFSYQVPFFVQLFGNQPEHFALTAQMIENLKPPQNRDFNKPQLLRPAGIDINLGCPAKKIIKQNSGCALMCQPQLVRKIILAILKNTHLPVSLKIRAGIQKVSALDFLKEIGDLNWQILSVHGRTFEQGFTGEINLALIKKIKKMFPKKIVLANGGIDSPEKAQMVLKKTTADGVMIGRAVLGRPWFLNQIKSYLTTGKYSQPNKNQIKKTILAHAQLFFTSPQNNPIEFRKHLLWYFKGRTNAKQFRTAIIKIKTLADVKKILSNF